MITDELQPYTILLDNVRQHRAGAQAIAKGEIAQSHRIDRATFFARKVEASNQYHVELRRVTLAAALVNDIMNNGVRDTVLSEEEAVWLAAAMIGA